MSSSLLGLIIIIGGVALYIGMLAWGIGRAMAKEEREILRLFSGATKNIDAPRKDAIMKAVARELPCSPF